MNDHAAQLTISDLRTCQQLQPLGLDEPPQFSWVIESGRWGVVQRSYQIIVAAADGRILWNSGVVVSRRQSFVIYGGASLDPRTRYDWTVTVWDEQGNAAVGKASFETGMLGASEWTGLWVESTIPRVEASEWAHGNQPPPVLFTREFNLNSSPKQARLYATAYGVYRPFVNGERVDDREFAPEHTVYRSLMYYQAYDVTNLLHSGKNVFSMYVGDGWYFCPQTEPIADHLRPAPTVLFQIDIEYDDGSIDGVCSDEFVTCATGPVLSSDLFHGEIFDARRPFDGGRPGHLVEIGYGHLTGQPMPPVRPAAAIPAVDVYHSPDDEIIVDFGQVVSGWARVFIDAPSGTAVTLDYFEVPRADGSYFNSMLVSQRDVYISDGRAAEYEPHFTYHGFRYVRVTGLTQVKAEDFTAIVLTSEKENAGSFRTSDSRLNRLYSNIRWSQTNNMLSIPTDCPTREKAGFTGDIQIYAPTALLNEKIVPFLASWLRNAEEDQLASGVVPMTVPYTRTYERIAARAGERVGYPGTTGIAGWGDAIVMVPYSIYQHTGSLHHLAEHYDAMCRWANYIIQTAQDQRGDDGWPASVDRSLWNTGFHFGEWLIPSETGSNEDFSLCARSARYVAPFFGCHTVRLLSTIARLLGKLDDAALYEDVAARMRQAIEATLLREGDPSLDSMGACVLALAFDLPTGEDRPRLAAKLVQHIEANGQCLDTGFLATPYLLSVLVDIGRRDLALNLLWQKEQPSWLFEVDHGATTVWEDWAGLDPHGTPMVTSYDHYAFGCVDEWIVRNVVGLRRWSPGFTHVHIEPEPDSYLSWAVRTHRTEHGQFRVAWTHDELRVTIPVNTTATLVWQKTEHKVGSGRYRLIGRRCERSTLDADDHLPEGTLS